MGGAAEQASSRFLGAVEQLETRIRELESWITRSEKRDESSLQHGNARNARFETRLKAN